jgi:pyruvate dehydrogenase E2 component (dihydrolipoamide acetyltransferase)
MRTFALPDLGEGLTDAEIVAWHVAAGDHVVADQPLVSVETAKAVIEIPAPWSGRIVRTFGAPHDILAIGAPLAEIETEAGADAGTVVGELPRMHADAGRAEPSVRARQVGPMAGQPVKVSPAVRQRAAAFRIDLTSISGTGPGGTITMADLQDRIDAKRTPDGLEPLRGVRRAMADAMAKSRAEIVTACLTDEAVVEGWAIDTDPTLRLIGAIVAGCRASPALNAWFDSGKQGRILHGRIDLAIAIEAADGLFAPVLRDVANSSAANLRIALDALKQGVKSRTIGSAHLRGPTITLSNFGMLGGRHALLTVVPPQVAILGAGRIYRAARVIGDEIRPVRVVPLSLSFDHRVVTGAEACKFMSAVVADLSRS